jgi:hypothetical protein
VIEASGQTWVYPLGTEAEYRVKGPLGTTVVRVSGSAAWILDSPCKDKLCVHQGKISASGEWAACLPNRVMIRLRGAPDRHGGRKPDAYAF